MTLHSTSACVGGRHVAAHSDKATTNRQAAHAKSQAMHPADAWELSPREREVIEAYMVDSLAKTVATKLGITPKTVEVHLGNIREKAGFARSIPMVLAYERMRRAFEEGSHGA